MPHVMVRWPLAGAFGLGLVTCLLAAQQPAQQPPLNSRQATQAAIIDLSDNLDAKDVSARAKKIVDDHDSCDISSVFRMKKGGGVGIGKAVEAKRPDSIERLVNDFAQQKTLTEAELEKYKDDYVRVARVLQAMAELAPHRGPQFVPQNTERAKKWQDVSAEFKVNTREFRKALEETDPKKVRNTAIELQKTCNNCHAVRDS